MTDSHLLNTIKLILKHAHAALPQEISSAWAVLGTLQGEMATYYCEQDIDRMEEMTPLEFAESRYPLLGNLIEDAERRHLDLEFLYQIHA